MKTDIETRADIEKLLSAFYETATSDAEIGHHFAHLDLETHLPVIVDFWGKVLFGKQSYFGNPFLVHQQLHAKFPLKLEHFRRWFELFSTTVDKLFVGKQAENAKLRAKMIAHSLNQNLNSSEKIINFPIA